MKPIKRAITDSRQKLAQMVESPGFTLPLAPGGEPHPRSSLSRLLQGPFIQNGDLCEVMPGPEALILVSPAGEKILMQCEGKTAFHVPAGWRLVVGSRSLKSAKREGKFSLSGMGTNLDAIPELYKEADQPFV